MTTKALREQRKKLAEDAHAILAKAVSESRAATQEELQTVDKIHADIDALKATIDRVERSEAEERAIVPESQRTTPSAEDRTGEVGAKNAAFRKWAAKGPNVLTHEDVRALGVQLSGNGSEITLRFLSPEERALTVTTTGGGHLIADAFSDRLEKSMLFYGGMITEADVVTTATGAPLDWPTYDDTTQKGAILAINTAVANQDIVFGNLTFDAYKYSSKQVLVPVELMQDSAFDMDSIVADVLGERLGRILNEHFTTGTGTAQPNGIVTASSAGKTGATGQTTSVTYDDLVDLVYSIDRAYRAGAKFMMNDGTVKAIRKLKDGQALPIWNVGSPTAGEPDTLLGYPVVVNNDVVVMAASAKSIIFGAIKKYKVRRVKDITLLRLNERYADAHQVGFLAFARFDGDLLDAGTDPVKHYANSAT